jgi:tripartite-type tricarboxylate transporter receptor subunit TctC
MMTWLKNGFIRVLVQTPRKRNPRLPDVPTVYELMDKLHVAQANRRMATVLLGTDNFGNFPTVGTPGIPADRVKILREAYAQALKEPDLLEEAKKRRWEVEHIPGEELQTLATEVINQPPDIVKRITELLETK